MTCGKCVLTMFEKLHKNDSKHSSVVWLVVFTFTRGMVCRSAIKASEFNVCKYGMTFVSFITYLTVVFKIEDSKYGKVIANTIINRRTL